LRSFFAKNLAISFLNAIRYGGARIYYIFNNVFGQALDTIAPCSNLSNNDIRTAIRNSTGPRPSLFVPEIAFDLLIKPQIKLLESPSLKCVELVYEELMKICHNCGSKVRTAAEIKEGWSSYGTKVQPYLGTISMIDLKMNFFFHFIRYRNCNAIHDFLQEWQKWSRSF
jgi:Dynamin central region